MKVDATQIHENLHQGGLPEMGRAVRDAGFDVLVLAAEEYQPDPGCFPGVKVIRAPFDDAPLDRIMEGTKPIEDLATADHAAHLVAMELRQGKKVLVTCHAGRNRSGLVCGLAMHKVHGWNGDVIVETIQKARQGALNNESFAKQIRVLKSLMPTMKRG